MVVDKFENDNAYLTWMAANPASFIVNTGRSTKSNMFVLHLSKCPHIATTTKMPAGAYTERGTLKIGSEDLNELKEYFTANYPNFKGEFKECQTCKPFSEKYIDNPIFLFPDTIEDETEVLFEGVAKRVQINAYERNPKARTKCLKHHGYQCSVCEMDFEKVYGIIGKNFIHVHHLMEVHTIGKEYRIDGVEDLRPVCPNCHSMLHQRKPCYTIEKLKEIIQMPLCINLKISNELQSYFSKNLER